MTAVDINAHRDLFVQSENDERRELGRGTRFDGNSMIGTGSALTGVVAAKTGTLHGWIYRSSDGPAARQVVLSNTSGRFELAIEASGVLGILGDRPSDGANVLDIRSTTVLTADKWHHLLASWDLGAGLTNLYLDDVSDINELVATDNLVDYARNDWAMGAGVDELNNLTGTILEIWLHAAYIDITDEDRRRQFITERLTQKFLGANGQRPTASQPILYIRGEPGTIRRNLAGRENFGLSPEGQPLLQEFPPVRVGI